MHSDTHTLTDTHTQRNTHTSNTHIYPLTHIYSLICTDTHSENPHRRVQRHTHSHRHHTLRHTPHSHTHTHTTCNLSLQAKRPLAFTLNLNRTMTKSPHTPRARDDLSHSCTDRPRLLWSFCFHRFPDITLDSPLVAGRSRCGSGAAGRVAPPGCRPARSPGEAWRAGLGSPPRGPVP